MKSPPSCTVGPLVRTVVNPVNPHSMQMSKEVLVLGVGFASSTVGSLFDLPNPNLAVRNDLLFFVFN